MSRPKLKVLNIEAATPKGTVKLQAAHDPVYLYEQLKSYFEQELLSDPKQLNTQQLQKTLNTKAKDIPALSLFTFDSDMRAGELMILLSVLQTTKSLGGHSKKYAFFPAWQLPNQKKGVKAFSGKESWDGFLLGISRTNPGDAIPIPLEVKSLMAEPKKPVTGSPNDQLQARLQQYHKHFQQTGSINCILAMPYTSENKLGIDVKTATDDLRATISQTSAGCVCMLSFPNDKNGKVAMSVLCVVVSQDPTFMQATNTHQWMRQINFGRAK